ncbi:MAG: NAD(P)H-dependent oxidoreductase [Nanoarchaeota archaeon]|nr:NAD(P)H-dependent oxidoreductase [Nanoarchaeota archaeon]
MILIIYAHPGEGHCSFILEETKACLSRDKENFEVLDLYKMGFDPVLPRKEHNTSGKGIPDMHIAKVQEKIKKAKTMIFIYPVWWGTMPAIMKGFFDRVFTSGFAFKYTNKMPQGLLKDKRAIVLATSGAPAILNNIGFANKALQGIKSDILEWCGIRTKLFVFGSALDPEKSMPGLSKFVRESLDKGL